MATATDSGTVIVRTPEIRGGRPRIAGTGGAVRQIVGWYKENMKNQAEFLSAWT